MLSVSRLLNGDVGEGDPLRYGRHSARLPSHLLHFSEDKKPVVVWTSTRRCNLHCIHCYTDSHDRAYEGELTTEEALAMIDDLAAFGAPVLLISGGEPLRRDDLDVVAARAIERGMRVVLSTNGTLLSEERAQRLASVGVSYVGISVDGMAPTHDRFRGTRGAFAASMAGVEAARVAGLRTGFRFTITRQNLDDLPWLFDLMVAQDVHRLCIYHLAPTGRGARIRGLTPSTGETRQALEFIFERTRALNDAGFEAEVLTADNHADNAYLLLYLARTQPGRVASVRRLLEWNGGNQSGLGVACIDADGTIYPDQFWRWQAVGNIRERPFSVTWGEDPPLLLRQLRDRTSLLPERCRSCRFLDVCNGNFRSRAEAVTGDPWGADPLCYLHDEEVTRSDRARATA